MRRTVCCLRLTPVKWLLLRSRSRRRRRRPDYRAFPVRRTRSAIRAAKPWSSPYRASSAQPAPFSSSDTVDAVTTAAAGDVVILSDPAGTDDPSNWAAVFRFLNPNDPTGADGLLADDVEGFDTSNVGSGGFANFKLFPNTIYLADVASGDTGRAGMYEELGLGGNGILPGQTAIFYYTVDVTGSGGTGPGGGSVPEPSTFLLIGLGGGALIAGRLRRYGRARA